MTVSLKGLVQTGTLGSARLGMSRSQIENCLGLPDVGNASRKYPKPNVWSYGGFELHFDPRVDRLILIHMGDFDVPSGGSLSGFDPWIIRQALTLSAAEEILTRSGIACLVEDYPFEDNAHCLRAGIGVRLIFIGENRQLRAISYSENAI